MGVHLKLCPHGVLGIRNCPLCVEAYRKENRKKSLARNNFKNRTDPIFRLRNYKYRCGYKHIPFELTDRQATRLMRKPCYYCGKRATLSQINGIDRKNSSLGYTTRNCVPCCSACNRMKNDTPKQKFLNGIKAIFLAQLKRKKLEIKIVVKKFNFIFPIVRHPLVSST